MSIGHKGMLFAAKALGTTMVDLFEDAKLIEAMQAEFKEKTAGHQYKPYIPEGPPPVPKSDEQSRSAK
jgi:aminobenzoyl-glutamate utilization protein B